MPAIFDNILTSLDKELNEFLLDCSRADFCVGYFNLRGWRVIANAIEQLPGGFPSDIEEGLGLEGNDENHRYCRLIVGMNIPPLEQIEQDLLTTSPGNGVDRAGAIRLKLQLAHELRKQLIVGAPTNEDERGLKQLLSQLKSGRLAVKLHAAFPLHAKLYIGYSKGGFTKYKSYLGSSNLTLSGLKKQGELNTDVEETASNEKLVRWFAHRWDDSLSLDITKELIQVLENSWANQIDPPYLIYLKMAYHLSQEAREGQKEFEIPKVFKKELLPFQEEAVKIAAKKLKLRSGVIIGDVVGLGKTITASCLARMYEESGYHSTLVICPPKLRPMWKSYRDRYGLKLDTLSSGKIGRNLQKLTRYKLIILDESHNFRTSTSKRYQFLKEYLQKNESDVILLTATPYNKTFHDLSAQLELFLQPNADLGLSPEKYIKELGGVIDFQERHPDTFIRGIKAFNHSRHHEDWQELMRLFMVRRTRSFIKENYAKFDSARNRHFINLPDGKPVYFPERTIKKAEFGFNAGQATDLYAQLYSNKVVEVIESLALPRYGLSAYILPNLITTGDEQVIIENLSKAGPRMIGYTKSGLFKRLESSGFSFLLSLQRHILRNEMFLYAIKNEKPFPINLDLGSNLDSHFVYNDGDFDPTTGGTSRAKAVVCESDQINLMLDAGAYKDAAKTAYEQLWKEKHHRQRRWISSKHFSNSLKGSLQRDNEKLLSILKLGKEWRASLDRKLDCLKSLLTKTHPKEKVLLFTQFADTATYIHSYLEREGLLNVGLVTGQTNNAQEMAQRFSPNFSGGLPTGAKELRVLIATDVLSEGQNLQDAHIIVNFDLPWALIRLVQRAGRVDRIGQEADTILCYSFLPEDGVETIIQLRSRLQQRMAEQAGVVGSDEQFFDGDPVNIADIYSEKQGLLDEKEDLNVDLGSRALGIFNKALKENPELAKQAQQLADVSFSAKAATDQKGVIVYTRTAEDFDSLTMLDEDGIVVMESQSDILDMAACLPADPMEPKADNHHELVGEALRTAKELYRASSGNIGKRSSQRSKLYHLLDDLIAQESGPLFENQPHVLQWKLAQEEIKTQPLIDSSQAELKAALRDLQPHEVAKLILEMRDRGDLVYFDRDHADAAKVHIICSLGLV